MPVFFDLPAIAVNKNAISEKTSNFQWTCIQYETKLGNGRLLMSSENGCPEEVVLNIALEGWHRIYCCMVDVGEDNYTHLKLTDDLCFSGMRTPKKGNPRQWASYEYMQEFYWKSANLTNQQIILKKPENNRKQISNLVWIRCEKMQDDEIKNYTSDPNRCVMAHFDVDPFVEELFKTEEETLIKLHAIKNSNIDICQVETFVHGDIFDKNINFPLKSIWPSEWPGKIFDPEKLYKMQIEYGHKLGMNIYAAQRMSAGNFISSFAPYYYNKNFFADNAQLYCKSRDGKTIKVCSYAYPETRKYMIERIKKDASYGFDGVSLIFIRGMHIGFEQPVIDRFKELYPNIDPRIIPITDERLHGVWCEFMTEFMRELRNSLGKETKINVLADYGLSTAKHLGLDVKTWASEGLINSVCQSDMETYEDLSGCLAEDGTIDMDKYTEKSRNTEIVKRNFGTNPDLAFSHVKEYLDLESYGVHVYHILPWANNSSVEEYNAYVEKMKSLGAKRFHSFNTNHLVSNLPEYNTLISINNENLKVGDLVTYYRTLSIDNTDISCFNPCWKG
ncbi:MAG: hypothetical protein E7656_04290 [Ruminococcaceae bacterium]|nr:hypothetical protein [Oscillospiraceae bacterium]